MEKIELFVQCMMRIYTMSLSELRRLDLNLLIVLRAVLQTRNVTLAAQKLNMSQPAVSRAIGRLRIVFEDQLFIKGAGGVLATPRAEALADSINKLLHDIDDLLGAQEFSAKTSDRIFRIATTDYGAIALLPSLAAVFAAEAPNAGIEVLPFSQEAFRRASNGDVDIVLYSDEPVPDDLQRARLFEETYISFVREGHSLKDRLDNGRLDLDAFLDYPHILVSVFGGRTGEMDDRLAALGRTRRIAMWLPYFATAAVIAAKTDFVLTFPERAARELASAHRLISFRPPLEIEGFGYQMLWHARTQSDAGSLWLRQQLIAISRS
ncbi:LysR family transcriptional regulator [Agrobacterium cavarae]